MGKIEPKISFILPTHNRVEWVAECVNGLLAQTVKEIEVVIVDDGSTDGTKEMLETWLKNEPRVRMFRNEKSIGAGMSRNRGNKEALAPIIAVCDDDDCYPTQRADRILKFFEKHSEGVMMTAPYVRIGYENEILEHFSGEAFDEEKFKKTGAVNYFCHPAAAYIKKDIYGMGGYKAETKLQTDDLQLVHDWIASGRKIGVAPEEYLCFHRVLPNSIMSKMRGFKEEWAGAAK